MKMLPLGLAALILMAAAPAVAGDQDFTLANGTGYTIEQVYVAASRSDNWEEDVMGRDVLADGEEVDILFDAAEGECNFDLKVVYDDGEVATWSRLNICAISTVSIYYNRATGRTWAETD